MGDLWDKIVAFFTSKGWSKEQAQGIAGNLYGESSLNPGAIGDGGKAYGLAQWHPDRQADFASVFGKSIKGSTFEEQLQFVNWELNNTEKKAGDALRSQTTVAGATQSFMQMFERPADGSSYGTRLTAAMGNIGSKALDWLKGPFLGGTSPLGDAYEALPDMASLDPTGVSGFLKDFFSGAMAARFSAVIVGVILIGLAIAAFMFMSDTGKTIIKTAAKV